MNIDTFRNRFSLRKSLHLSVIARARPVPRPAKCKARCRSGRPTARRPRRPLSFDKAERLIVDAFHPYRPSIDVHFDARSGLWIEACVVSAN